MEILNNYFQRYSEKENVVTDNTMRFFSIIKENNFDCFNAFLEKIGIIDDKNNLNVNIRVQEKYNNNSSSVPDAIIFQSGYEIIIEVKLLNNFTCSQLENHAKHFNKKLENNVLLTIGKEKMENELRNKVNQLCKTLEIKHINLTFSDIITNMDDIISQNNYGNNKLFEILQDYKNFCSDIDILDTSHCKMYAFTCNITKEINLKYNIYYRPRQNYENFDYLGLYFDKKIGYIGKVVNVVTVKIENGETIINDDNIDLETKNKILEVLNNNTLDLKVGSTYNFYIIDKYVPTDFKKVTLNPLWGRKLFDLKEVLNVDVSELSIEEIAEKLKDKTWE